MASRSPNTTVGTTPNIRKIIVVSMACGTAGSFTIAR